MPRSSGINIPQNVTLPVALLAILLVGVFSAGIGLFYVPNTYYKPPWIPNDPTFDFGYALAQAEQGFAPNLQIDTSSLQAYVPSAPIDVSSLTQTVASGPPVDQVAALSQDINALQMSLPSASDYQNFANQASVDASQAWTATVVVVADSSGDSNAPSSITHFTFLSMTNYLPLKAASAPTYSGARPVVGAVSISHPSNGGITVTKLAPSQLAFQGQQFTGTSAPSANAGKQYAVTATRSVTSNIIQNTAHKNFYASANTFVNGFGHGLIKFAQKPSGQLITPILALLATKFER